MDSKIKNLKIYFTLIIMIPLFAGKRLLTGKLKTAACLLAHLVQSLHFTRLVYARAHTLTHIYINTKKGQF